MQNSLPKARQSNIELLRLIMALGVVILHYNNRKIGGALEYTEYEPASHVILLLLESVFICSVNVFVMISGYFLSKNDKRSVGKAIVLLMQLSVMRIALYLFDTLTWTDILSLKNVISHLVPIHWFITLYVVLYLVSPLLNKGMRALNSSGKKYYLILAIVIFLGWTFMIDIVNRLTGTELVDLSPLGRTGSGNGYTIINFMLCYALGMSINWFNIEDIRIRNIKIRKWHLIIILILLTGLITFWSVLDESTSLEYCNPLVVSEAYCFVILFLMIKMKENKVINKLSSAAFTIIIVHGTVIKYLKIDQFAVRGPMVLICHLVISLAIIFLISIIVDISYKLIFGWLIKRLSKAGTADY